MSIKGFDRFVQQNIEEIMAIAAADGIAAGKAKPGSPQEVTNKKSVVALVGIAEHIGASTGQEKHFVNVAVKSVTSK